MANFDFKNLILINPCKFNDECYARAMHARDILENAEIYNSFKEATNNIDFLIGTSSIETKSDKKHLRNPVNIDDMTEKIFDVNGNIGIVFGREDFGLYNEELAECDIMVKIPSSESYHSLNLSHAVCLILYTLYIKQKYKPRKKRTIGKIEKEKLYEYFSELLDVINYPEHKKEKTNVMFKRIMGRSMPSKWEYHTLMGVLSKAIYIIKNVK